MVALNRVRHPNVEGMNLLVSILMCYPEIGTVSYEPRDGDVLHFSYALKSVPPRQSYETLGALLQESIETYHTLAGYHDARLEIFLEGQGHTAFFHVIRDVRTMSQGELAMINELICEHFGDTLITEPLLDVEDVDDRELDAREEIIDHMIGSLRLSRHSAERMVGIREEGRVLVFNK